VGNVSVLFEDRQDVIHTVPTIVTASTALVVVGVVIVGVALCGMVSTAI
jgi:hypothetical protein